MKHTSIIILILTSLFFGCEEEGWVDQGEYYQIQSQALGRTEPVLVYPPDNLNSGTGVIYLLNGWGTDPSAWGSGINLGEEANKRGLMFVSLTAWDNQYLNYSDRNNADYEDYMLEVVAAIEDAYELEIGYAQRALCGISNGGGGVVYLLSHYPAYFAAGASLSGTVYSGINYAGLKSKGLRLEMGTSDALLSQARALHQRLRDNQINHEYHEHAGGHDWDFWKAYAPDQFDFLMGEMILD